MEAILPKAAQLASNLGLPEKLATVIQAALMAEGVPPGIADKVTGSLADRAQTLLVEAGVIHLSAPETEIEDLRQ